MKLGFTKMKIGKWSLLVLLLLAGVGDGWGQATDLFFSEYVEGSSSNKYLEIYNGTGSDVDLSDYEIRLYANGSSSATTTNTLSGTLTNGSTIVYRNSGATIYSGSATILGAVNFNGDDAVELYKISTTSSIDIIGNIGCNPGSSWTVGTGSTANRTLVRNASVCGGLTIDPGNSPCDFGNASEWTVFAQDNVSNLGNHSASCSAPSSSTLAVNTTIFGNISSLIDTQVEAVLNFDFDYEEKDAGLSQISQIVFNQGVGNEIADWSEVILGAELSDGTNSTTTATINANNITFAGIGNGSGELGEVLANATKTYSLRIWLRTDISTTIDGSDFVFEVNNASFTFDAGGLATSQSISSPDAENIVEVIATELQFSNVPTSVNVATDFGLSVSATDANGNVDADNSSSIITLSKNSGSGAFSSTTTLVKTLASGVASWADLQNDATGSFTISADDGAGLTDAVSSSITVNNLPTTIVIQDFEGTIADNWNFTPTPSFDSFAASDDIWGIRSTAIGGLATMPSSSSNYLAGQDILNGDNGSGTATIDFAAVNVSSYTNISISFDYEVDGYDNDDDVDYTVTIDGIPQTPVKLVDGFGNLDANGTVIIPIADGSSSVSISITVTQNGDDYIGLDNFSLIGSAVVVPGTSDVVAGVGTEPAAISSLTTSTLLADGYQTNFDFTVEDDGVTSGTDALPTLINQIVVNQGTGNEIIDWTTVFSAVNLVSGSETFAGTINTDNITFSSIPNGTGTALGFVGDDATKTYELKVVLQNPLPANTDNMIVAFVVDRNSFTVEASGSSGFETGAGTALESGNTNNEIQVDATALSASLVPSGVFTDENFSLTINAVDARGNIDSDATPTVTASRNSGTGTLSSATGLQQTLSAGTFTWNDLQYNTVEVFDIDFTDDASTLTATNSGSINATELAKIAITEWISDPTGTQPDAEWIELYNFGSSSVDIANWEVSDEGSDNNTITAASTIIPAGGYFILAGSKSTFETEWLGGVANPLVFENPSFFLANGGDEIIIKNASGDVIWSVAYTSDATASRATHFAQTTFSPRVWGSESAPGINRNGLDATSGTLGYESNNNTIDPLAYQSATGNVGSPLGGQLPVIWSAGAWSNVSGANCYGQRNY